MTRLPISPAAGALLRALVARSRADRHRILLTDVQSTDWQSLTFSGERHHLALRVTGRDSDDVAERMCAGLEDVEFSIPGLVVADVGMVGTARRCLDGATELVIEALTIASD
jgi:hypothetical protein